MATIKLSYWKKSKSVLVSDETKTLTIAYWPKVELVLITPTAVAASTFLPRLNLLGVG